MYVGTVLDDVRFRRRPKRDFFGGVCDVQEVGCCGCCCCCSTEASAEGDAVGETRGLVLGMVVVVLKEGMNRNTCSLVRNL